MDSDDVLTEARIAYVAPQFDKLSGHLNADQKYRIAHLLPIICGVRRFSTYLKFVLDQNVPHASKQGVGEALWVKSSMQNRLFSIVRNNVGINSRIKCCKEIVSFVI